jgi:hypothetical protein
MIAIGNAWKEREIAIGYKGKKRTDALIEFLCGAMAGAGGQNTDLGMAISMPLFMVSIRGAEYFDGYIAARVKEANAVEAS